MFISVYLIEGRKKLEIKRVVENDRIGEFINVEFSQYATDCVVTLNFEELAYRVGYELESYEDVTDINTYETIVYIGALYAGGVMGMKKTFKNMKECGNHRIIIATVGLADPGDKENTDTIKNGMKNQLSKEVYDKAMIVHLRGGIDYSKLGLKHKTMMGMLYKKAVTLPEEKKTAEVKAMIETYNKQVDFVDFNSLDSIIQEL